MLATLVRGCCPSPMVLNRAQGFLVNMTGVASWRHLGSLPNGCWAPVTRGANISSEALTCSFR